MSESATHTPEDVNENIHFSALDIYKRILWIALMLGVCYLAFYQFSRSDVLPIQEIEVSGEFSQLESKDIRPIVARGVGGNFFTLNVTTMYQELLGLPWVEKVWVHRIWPDTIKVNLQEQKPLAILKDKGLLNRNAQVFSKDSREFLGELPVFIVADSYVSVSVEQYQRIANVISSINLGIKEYYFDERKSQKIKLSNGILINLGRVDVMQRLKRFVNVYPMFFQQKAKDIKTIDLRYTNGFAVSSNNTSAKLYQNFVNYVA